MGKKEMNHEDQKPFYRIGLSTIIGALAFGFTVVAAAVIIAFGLAAIPFWSWFEQRGRGDRRDTRQGE